MKINTNKKRTLVLALGGNALGNNALEQRQIVQKTAKIVVDLADNDVKLVVCHGNGPQVGMIDLAFLNASQFNSDVPFLPLPEAGSMSQGYIGFHLQNAILNELKKRKMSLRVATLITQTVVDRNDPAFSHFTKPVGKFYSETVAKDLAKKHNWVVHNDANRGWRRFVPSPIPKKILEKESIIELLNQNHIVVACGGGGIPVYENSEGSYLPIAAVIDKDFTAAKIAASLNADQLLILTNGDYVSVNYGKPNETNLEKVNIQVMEHYLQKREFGIGSMEPKVKAAVNFLKERPDKSVIITDLNNCAHNLKTGKGTIITAK